MSDFKMLRYFLNQGDRQKNIEAVEQELHAMGYKRRETWVEDRRSNIFLCYIITLTDGTYYFGDPWSGLIEAQDRPIPSAEELSKPSKEAREFWALAFCSIAQSPRPLEKTLVEMADQAMAEWQKRFEA
jgi:hypothetical protein